MGLDNYWQPLLRVQGPPLRLRPAFGTNNVAVGFHGGAYDTMLEEVLDEGAPLYDHLDPDTVRDIADRLAAYPTPSEEDFLRWKVEPHEREELKRMFRIAADQDAMLEAWS